MLKGIERNDVDNIIKTPANYEELCKLAIAYSDGVIQNSEKVNENVMKFARESGIPVLDYQSPETYADAFNNFYDEVAMIRHRESVIRLFRMETIFRPEAKSMMSPPVLF